jgi:hypothetical protein
VAAKSPEALARARASVKAWKAANPARVKELRRLYGERNRERENEARRKWNLANPEKRKAVADRSWIKRIEVTQEAVAGRPRPAVCEVCGRPPNAHRRLAFDHCHQSGKFRGWLCLKCNVALGMSDDRPAVLRALAEYLERNA